MAPIFFAQSVVKFHGPYSNYFLPIMNHQKSYLYGMVLFAILISASTLAYSLPFGSPDSRSISMGKTGVASAGSTNAAYFNPALLAVFSERKHLGGNQRIAIPTLSGFASDSALELEHVRDADYENRFNRAVVDFNNNVNIDEFIADLKSLEDDLATTSATPLFVDAQAGFIFRIPDRRQGGAFSYGQRAVLDGHLDYTSDDAALLAAYLEELDFVNGGGAPGTLHPELYSDGQLNNPKDGLTSSADALALIIEEVAVSMGWEVTWWDVHMMFGITPKVVRVTALEYEATATSGDLTRKGERDNHVNVNLDLGFAKQINDQLLVGLTIKDFIPQRYRTASDRPIDLKPQFRIGAAYRSKWGNYALDLDLLENDPLYSGEPSQELGLGGEWEFWNQQLRAGVVKNLAGSGPNSSPVYTFGFRQQFGAFYSDLTYGRGKHHETAALQFGLHF